MRTGADGRALAFAEALHRLGIGAISAADREAIGQGFHFLAMGDGVAVDFPECARVAVRAVGVEPGMAIPLALRNAFGLVLGFAEPPMPAWAVEGAWVVGDDYGHERRARIASVGPEGAVVGLDPEPLPAGVLMARWRPVVVDAGHGQDLGGGVTAVHLGPAALAASLRDLRDKPVPRFEPRFPPAVPPSMGHVGRFDPATGLDFTVARGGTSGMESNRERAKRGGPMGGDALSVYLDGHKIAGAPMDRVEVGVDHASGPDFTATQRVIVDPNGTRHAVTLAASPGIRAWLAEAQTGSTQGAPMPGTVTIGNGPHQRAVAVCTGDSPRMVGEQIDKECSAWMRTGRTSRAMPVDEEQPDPAPGQVWLPPEGVMPTDPDGTLTIADVALPALRADTPYLHWTNGNGCCSTWLARGWTCIGVATPHGRVMVGGGFAQPFGEPRDVAAVGAGDSVLLRAANGWEHWTNARSLTDPSGQWTRTRYAPARVGERYRDRVTGEVAAVAKPFERGERMPIEQWERLDPGTPAVKVREHSVSMSIEANAAPADIARAVEKAFRPSKPVPLEWAEAQERVRRWRIDLDAFKAYGRVPPMHIRAAAERSFAEAARLDAAALPSLTRDGWRAEVRSNARWPGDTAATYVMHVTSPTRRLFAGPHEDGHVMPAPEPQSAAELADFLGFCMAGVEAESAPPPVGSTIKIKRPLSALRAVVDRLIAADHGPFAHARAAALRAWGEQPRPTGLPFADPAQRLADLHTYEEMRGGGVHPSIRARDFAAEQIGTGTIATYERERCRSDAYARGPR